MIRSRTSKLLGLVVVTAVLSVLLPAAQVLAAVQHPSPFPRLVMGMAYDAADGQVVLFGGEANGIFFGDTWTWDGTVWTKEHPAHSPSRRSNLGVAYDAADGQVVLFGGYSAGVYLRDTWTWDGSDWTKQHPAHSPSPRAEIGMAKGPDGHVVLFGGIGRDVYGDTWTWDGIDWTHQSPAHTPAGAFDQGMAYDAADGETVLFGGALASGGLGNDTWTWDGTDWTKQAPAHIPPARYAPGMGYEASNEQIVLFGGLDNQDFGDTWTWDGIDWTHQSPAHSPNGRHGHAMSADAAGGVVLFGGYVNGGHQLGDTWEWDGADWTQRPGGSVKVLERKAPPGGSILVYVWGFSVGEHVKVSYLDSVNGSTKLAKLKADGSGAATIMSRIPGNATPGTQHIKAKGASSGQIAKAKFTVE
jgi:Galactose oxidase, central domain